MNDLKDLIAAVAQLNEVMGAPATPMIHGEWLIGNYHSEWAAGGVRIARIVDASGAVEHPFGLERKNAREACNEVQGLIKANR